MNTRDGILGRLRFVSLIAVVVGIVGSEILVFREGSSQRLLVVLFVVWILLPFVALAWANWVSTRWPTVTRVALYVTTIVIVLGSLAFYGRLILPPAGSAHAFPFVAGPMAAWALMVIVVPAVALVSRKR